MRIFKLQNKQIAEPFLPRQDTSLQNIEDFCKTFFERFHPCPDERLRIIESFQCEIDKEHSKIQKVFLDQFNYFQIEMERNYGGDKYFSRCKEHLEICISHRAHRKFPWIRDAKTYSLYFGYFQINDFIGGMGVPKMNCDKQPWAIEIKELDVVCYKEFKFRIYEIQIDHSFLRGVEFLDSIFKGFFQNSEDDVLNFMIRQIRRNMVESVRNYNNLVTSPADSILMHFQIFLYQQEHNDLLTPNPVMGKGFYRDIGHFIINRILCYEKIQNPINTTFVSYLQEIRSKKLFETKKAFLESRGNYQDQNIIEYILIFQRDSIFEQFLNNYGDNSELRTIYVGKLKQMMDGIFYPAMKELKLEEFILLSPPLEVLKSGKSQQRKTFGLSRAAKSTGEDSGSQQQKLSARSKPIRKPGGTRTSGKKTKEN